MQEAIREGLQGQAGGVMKMRNALAAIGKRLRKLDSAVGDVKDLIERSLHEKSTGKPAPPLTRGDVGASTDDQRKRAK